MKLGLALLLLLLPLQAVAFEENVDLETGKIRQYVFTPNNHSSIKLLQYQNGDLCIDMSLSFYVEKITDLGTDTVAIELPPYLDCTQPE